MGLRFQRGIVLFALPWASGGRERNEPSQTRGVFVTPGVTANRPTGSLHSRGHPSHGTGIVFDNLARQFYSAGAGLLLLVYLILPLFLFGSAGLQAWRNWIIPGAPLLIAEPLHPSIKSPLFLIPGVTLPWVDLPAVLLAGFLSICWHETGHAVAAMIEGVPILSAGVVVVLYLLPGAYISLCQGTLELLPDAGRIRIILSGIWHNLVLALFLYWTVVSHPAGYPKLLFVSFLGYQDLNDRGVVVQSVEQGSPLAPLLQPGIVITQLDDLELHDSTTYHHWDRYLLSPSPAVPSDKYITLGWCVPDALWKVAHDNCCRDGANSTTGRAEVCFEATGNTVEQPSTKCLEPVAILQLSRCVDTCSDTTGPKAVRAVCVRATFASKLLRVTTVDLQHNGRTETIFYQGDKVTLWEQIGVGSLRAPGHWWAAQGLPQYLKRFWGYVYSISVSLAVINLLALPHLDGGELLEVLIEDTEHRELPSTVTAAKSSYYKTKVFDRYLKSLVDYIRDFRMRRRLFRNSAKVRRLVHVATAVTLCCFLFVGVVVQG